MGSSHAIEGILAVKPAQRTADDVEQLVTFLSEQPFFAGVPTSSLELLSACLAFHQAAPGEVVLHAGELTDRMYLLLSGSCSVVRHSRREGFQPQPPQQLAPGQTLCEAALVVSGRRSDVVVTAAAAVPPPQPAAAEATDGAAGGGDRSSSSGSGGGNGSSSSSGGGGSGGDGDGSGGGGGGDGSSGGDGARSGSGGGGAALAVLTRAAWSNMCARAPLKPEYGEARLALLCCCARALASTDPDQRTLEQAEDLAALLRLLPGLSHTSAPVLRAMSEAAHLRELPPGTILFEECTRAESEFVVLSGAVQTHTRPKRQGAANRAALRSALRSAVAAARGKSARGPGPKGPGGEGQPPKTIRQKIEEERRAREQIKQSLALQREGLRTPKAATRPTGARAVEEEFKRWMLEFLSRKRSGDANAAANATPGVGVAQTKAAAAAAAAARGLPGKAANAWRRAAALVLHTGADGDGDGAAREALERPDTTLAEYERRKLEEAGGVKDVGNLLGGAAARKAYMRGLAMKDGGMYDEEDEPEDAAGPQTGPEASRPDKAGGVRWGPLEEEAAAEAVDEVEEEEEGADPWVRLTFLDRRYQVVRKPIRYIDAVEKVMGIAKQDDSGKSASGGGGGGGSGGAAADRNPAGTGGGDTDADGDETRAAEDVDLLLMLNGADDDAAGGGPRGGGGGGAVAGGGGSGPSPDDVVDDAGDEHFEQLYGTCGGRVEAGQVAGELPAAVLDRSSKRGGPQRTRRAHSAIAGPSGADVLVVVLDALRRGAEAARDDLVAGRLAVLRALEPLRGLSDEHQAAMALGCSVVSLDANHVVVRQGQPVEALYVVLEGEVRLLDDPDTIPAVAPPPPPQAALPAAAAAGGAAAAAAPGAAAPAGLPGPLSSLRIRRAAAALSALTLLGPGGSFGESVLGYPEDVAAAAAAAARDTRDTRDGDAEAEPRVTCQHLATAMTARPSKLLVLPRSLLSKYGYLRTSLPPFAHLRREAINGRRTQLQASLQNRPAAAAAAAAAAVAPPPPASSAGSSSAAAQAGAVAASGPGSAAAAAAAAGGGGSGILGALQLPSLPPPMAAIAAAAATGAVVGSPGAYQVPRPPPVRPSEVLEQFGFKPVLRRIYNAGTKTGAAAAAAAAAAAGGGPNGATPASGNSLTAAGGGSNGRSSSSGGPGPLPYPIVSVNSLAAGGGGGGGSDLDRQRRRELLAASALGANGPQSLLNAIARARGEDPPSPAPLPIVVHSAVSALAAAAPPPYRGSVDGMVAAASATALPTPFSPGAAAAAMAASRRGQLPQRPLRVSISGVGSFVSDCNSPSPVRRCSFSGMVVTNGSLAGAGASGPVSGSVFSMPALASPPPPLRGSGTGGAGGSGSFTRVAPPTGTSASAPSPHVASVQLPRLSVPGSGSGPATPVAGGGGGGGGRPLARPSAAGESLLLRLEAADSSPRSFSSQHQPPSSSSRSGSYSSLGGIGGGGSGGAAAAAAVAVPPPLGVSVLGQQRSASHQSMAKA
ncbi:hypothetical protein PLESTB_000734500 [Pleodorina starrii]|uniref:Cyclic nucleotide-binding domain-containing protein n=1 Tax=Pleodorina starrii TaxID=330485 RepID=A0A9W6BKP8_9CHLO|nr:hypothetical protein PLESTM_000189900 [Pleodorina starrii]GLC53347.1 hypothetical protein PLESTB_000734500 [Pleodorina starrii]GLC67183.1 hypothetical protein PLESTF_000526700 [Pleodorina starrii]